MKKLSFSDIENMRSKHKRIRELCDTIEELADDEMISKLSGKIRRLITEKEIILIMAEQEMIWNEKI